MGTPAYSHGYAMFNTTEDAATALPLFKEWAQKANEGKLPDPNNGSFSVYDITQDGETIEYHLESGRVQNCVWQAERVREYFSKQPECFQVEQDVMTCDESVNWYRPLDDDGNEIL